MVWRAGIDLSPVDVTDDDAVRWLETMVWPEQEERRERLRAAVRIAREDPPYLVRGDLLDELPALVAQAPAQATLVVFHSAVIAYLEPADRERFATMMAGLVADGAVPLGQQRGPAGAARPRAARRRRTARAVRARRRRPPRRPDPRPRRRARLALTATKLGNSSDAVPGPEMDDGTVSVLIVGGGIAGLATARALRARGIEARVLERSVSHSARGTGVYLPANAVRAIGELGLSRRPG